MHLTSNGAASRGAPPTELLVSIFGCKLHRMTGMARHAAKTSPNKWIILMPQRLRSCLARIKVCMHASPCSAHHPQHVVKCTKASYCLLLLLQGGHVPQVLHSPWAPQAVSFTCGFACSSLRTLAAELAQQPLEVTSSTEIAEADEQSAGNTAMPATSAAGQLPQAAEDSERVQSGARAGPSGKASAQRTPQLTCDFTMLAACAWELRDRWVPAKVDQVLLGAPSPPVDRGLWAEAYPESAVVDVERGIAKGSPHQGRRILHPGGDKPAPKEWRAPTGHPSGRAQHLHAAEDAGVAGGSCSHIGAQA